MYEKKNSLILYSLDWQYNYRRKNFLWLLVEIGSQFYFFPSLSFLLSVCPVLDFGSDFTASTPPRSFLWSAS